MKILDIPQSGKEGLNVSENGRFGPIRRALVIPSNPQTLSQRTVRAHLTICAQNWAKLTDEQRAAWTAAGKQQNAKARCGTTGPLTGSNLFTKVNAVKLEIGDAVVTDPPAKPAFELNPVSGLSISNTGGTITLKLNVPGAFAQGVSGYVEGAAPMSQGRSVCRDFRVLGEVPAPTNQLSDISALYKGRFGSPPVGSRVFVAVWQTQNGYKDQPMVFSAVVPASS